MAIQLSFGDILLAAHNPRCSDFCCVGNKRKRQVAMDSMNLEIVLRGDSKDESYVYKTNKEKVALECSQGHKFRMSPNSYKLGHGCPRCAGRCPSQSQQNFECLVKERGDTKGADYVYISSSTRVSLVCSQGHKFWPIPAHYKNGRCCPKCTKRCPQQAKEKFERLLQSLGCSRGDTYVYAGTKAPVSLVCPQGHEFKTTPNSFNKGNRCAQCAGLCPVQAQKSLEREIDKRGDSRGADYIYVNHSTKVSLVCAKGHRFEMLPGNYRRRHGCSQCSSAGGFNPSKSGVLYYVVFFPSRNRTVYKIGISNFSATRRYRGCKTPFKVIWEKWFESGVDCRHEEARIISEFATLRCHDKPVDGLSNRELFDLDIFGHEGEIVNVES